MSESFDAELVIYRLEEAGATLLAIPGSGWSTRLRSSSLEIVRTAIESYGWTASQLRPPTPSAERISRMDEAMEWISLIPLERYVLRRIVGLGAWCTRSRSGTYSVGDVWPPRSVRTTRPCSAGTHRGSSSSWQR